MKTFIWNSTTGQYLNSRGEWTKEQAEALAFESSLAALGYMLEKDTRNALIVLRFSDSRYDIHLHPFSECVAQPLL